MPKNGFAITAEHLRVAILAAARECDIEVMHKLTLAYHRLTGHEDGEEPDAPIRRKYATGNRKPLPRRIRENACGND